MSKTIEINDQLYNEIDAARKKNDAGQSMEATVEHLLREGLTHTSKDVYEQHDEKKIMDRLKSLGYID